MLYCAAFGCKHDSARYIELSFFRFPLEKIDSSEAINSQLRAGWLDMLDFVRPILKSRILKLIYFQQLMGQRPSKRRRPRTLKPEAVPTIFQHVPQPKALTQRKHSIKRTVKSERQAVSKQRMNGLSFQIS